MTGQVKVAEWAEAALESAGVIHLDFIEISAKLDRNVTAMFENVARRVMLPLLSERAMSSIESADSMQQLQRVANYWLWERNNTKYGRHGWLWQGGLPGNFSQYRVEASTLLLLRHAKVCRSRHADLSIGDFRSFPDHIFWKILEEIATNQVLTRIRSKAETLIEQCRK